MAESEPDPVISKLISSLTIILRNHFYALRESTQPGRGGKKKERKSCMRLKERVPSPENVDRRFSGGERILGGC